MWITCMKILTQETLSKFIFFLSPAGAVIKTEQPSVIFLVHMILFSNTPCHIQILLTPQYLPSELIHRQVVTNPAFNLEAINMFEELLEGDTTLTLTNACPCWVQDRCDCSHWKKQIVTTTSPITLYVMLYST